MCECYNGDTPEERRQDIRKKASVIFTNPDMLHCAILSNHAKWERFFKNLSLIVVDEVHTYRYVALSKMKALVYVLTTSLLRRGIFGTHLAFIL